MDRDQSPPTDATRRHPSTVALAVLLSFTLLVALVLGWLWFTRYAPLHFDTGSTPTIADARDATYIFPLVLLGIFLTALTWIIVWILLRWQVTLLPICIGVIGVFALLFSGFEFSQGANSHHQILVTPYICDADATRIERRADRIPAGCDPASSTISVMMGTPDDPAMIVPDTAEGGLSRFQDLPRGRYNATLTATGHADTASVTLVVETVDGIRTVSHMDHGGDAWSGGIALHPSLETYALLLYTSPHQAAPDASITFTVRECRDASPATFDPSACETATLDAPILEELPSPDIPPGRPAHASIEGETMTLANLEARSYTLTPTIALVSMTRDGQSILVIPAGEPQDRVRSILQPGGAVFGTLTIDIGEETGGTEYNVYTFDDGQTVAQSTGPLAGVRP